MSGQPIGGGSVNRSVMLARHRDIQPDQAQRAKIGAPPVQRAGGGQASRKGRAKGIAVVVIAGQQQQGKGQVRQDGAGAGIFIGRAHVAQIAGKDHRIGRRVQRVQRRNGGGQRGGGIGNALVQHPRWAKMGIGDLGYPHRIPRQGGGRLGPASGLGKPFRGTIGPEVAQRALPPPKREVLWRGAEFCG